MPFMLKSQHLIENKKKKRNTGKRIFVTTNNGIKYCQKQQKWFSHKMKSTVESRKKKLLFERKHKIKLPRNSHQKC